ncbi:hypothetical protein [Streptomyces sp. NPDC051776]|uniref:hypothetical protein n=1 Tax=Streptomyces sp. NPDC051776 TaxID=3155414 RepID=UPI00343F223D
MRERAFRILRDHPASDWPVNWSWLPVMVLCAEGGVRRTDRRHAAELVPLMRPWEDRLAVFGTSLLCLGPMASRWGG